VVRGSPCCCILVLHDGDRNACQLCTETDGVTSNADDVPSAILSRVFEAMLSIARLKIARLLLAPMCPA
jgi:hypothetical protein